MTDRQFFWGLSNGALVLTIGGFFWFGIAMSATPSTQPFVLVLVIAAVALGLGARRLRRKATGFSRAELDRQEPATRRILVGMRWTGIAQGVAAAIAVSLCVWLNRRDLIWPAVGLVVALHFLPLARVFNVRAYYATGLAGTVVSLAALAGALGPSFLAISAAGMGAIMWLTVWHLLRHAEQIVATGMSGRPALV